MRIRNKICGAITLTVAGLAFWLVPSPVQAKSTVYYTGSAALTGAPQGVHLNSAANKGYFTISNDVADTDGDNAAKLVDAGSPTGIGNSAIQISKAGATNSWGSIWSTDKTFDLSKPETASMWIYASGESTSNIGDGMAFVLQNDANGVNAFSGTKVLGSTSSTTPTVNDPGVGESMGVWGVDPESYNSTNLGDSAIQNSWALEFDTFNNAYTPPSPLGLSDWYVSAPSSFDLGKYYNNFDSDGNPTGSGTAINSSDNHIASNYPGDSSTYSGATQYGYKDAWSKSTTILGFAQPSYWTSNYYAQFYYYTMKHLGYLDEGATASGNLSDHRWHHITISYTPPTGTDANGSMTYTYDDKNADTGLPQTPANSATVPIILSKFNLASGSTKVRWGFTGSTGQNTENNDVIFDQIPGEADSSASATLSQKSNDGTYSTVNSSTSALTGGTAVKLEYDFKRTGGSKDWEKVNADLKIPSSISLTSGIITNPDGSDGGKVDLSKLNGTDLPVSLGSSGDGVTLSGTQEGKITLYGTVGNTAATENSTTSYFQGTNASSAAELTGFTVKKAPLNMDIDDTASKLKVNYDGGQDASVTGVAVPTDTTLTRSDITIHPTLNGVDLDAFKMDDEDYINPNYGNTGFTYPIASSKLKAGTNTISFYATDSSGDTSPIISRNITAGTVQLGDTSGNLSFGSAALSGNDDVLSRDGNWSLDVDDSLTSGSTWELDATTTGMFQQNTATSTPLDGALIYTDSDGVTTTLGSNATKISGGTSDGTTTSTNIAQGWSNSNGIRLKVNSGAVEGNYAGNITWSFVNSVQ